MNESKGNIQIALFNYSQKDIFPDISQKEVKILTIEAKKKTIHKVSFENLKSGYYAVIAFHDINKNKEIDTFLGIPREALGSSGASVKGKPTFKKTKFFIPKNKTKTIKIKLIKLF